MTHKLPSRSLPSRSLPYHALRLIHEYSKPLTRPDWRKSKPIITSYKLYISAHFKCKYTQLMFNLLLNIIETDWYYLYMNVNYNGLNNVFIKLDSLMKIDGIKEALINYESTHI
jgi:hypothetical protein